VGIFSQTGRSVFAATLYHAIDNVGWSLFPNQSSHYDPAVTGLLNWVVVFIIILAGGMKQQALASKVKLP
jgi:hypothetical protein